MNRTQSSVAKFTILALLSTGGAMFAQQQSTPPPNQTPPTSEAPPPSQVPPADATPPTTPTTPPGSDQTPKTSPDQASPNTTPDASNPSSDNQDKKHKKNHNTSPDEGTSAPHF